MKYSQVAFFIVLTATAVFVATQVTTGPRFAAPTRVAVDADGSVLSVTNEGAGSAVEGIAVEGDAVIGRSRHGLAGRFDGRVRAQVLEITGGADLVEPFDVVESESLRPGAVVTIDPALPGTLRVSSGAYDRTVAGVVSGANGLNPGLSLVQKGMAAVDGSTPVALTGRVYAWADASNGPIQPGDLLTTSQREGHAMKVTEHERACGAVIGKAMTALSDGTGLVLVLVSLQ